ncbi:GDSL/SGNH-like acyl-esterase family found in Pmr5 and Cas1p-domain-containing protein [Powellomyces hirtus]|nr:GDSL/SGNH-like acyl-esterase family found in Pmr5 and Cas1p-domain-containing protein [Powellomyces hirtus]
MARFYTPVPTNSSASPTPASANEALRKRVSLVVLLPLLTVTAIVASLLTTYSPAITAHLGEAVGSGKDSQPESSGNWTRRPEGWRDSKYRERYASCPLLDTQDQCEKERYDRLLRWKWEGSERLAGLGPELRLGDVVRKCLNGRIIGLSGDSLNRQSFHSLACLMYADGAMLTKTREGRLDKVVAKFQNSTGSTTLLWTGDDLNPYLLDYTGNRPEPKIDFNNLHPALKELVQADPDWLLLNTGLWIDASSFKSRIMDFYQAYSRIITTAISLIDGSKADATKVVFRTSPMRHYQGGDYNSDGTCASLVPRFNTKPEDYYGGYAESLQNERLKRAVASHKDVTILDAASVALARADAHRSTKDCSHYCLPGVPDAWNEVFLKAIWDTCLNEEAAGTSE